MTTALARWFNIEPSPQATVDPKGARCAAMQAQAALETERARVEQTAQTTSSLRELRERNHWAELLYDSMEPK